MFGQRLSTNSSRSKSGSRPQQTSKNDNPRRGPTLAVRSVGALESRHASALESPCEIRDNIVDRPHDGSHGDSSRIAHREVTTDKCISLGARHAPRSYPPPEVYTSSPQCPLCSKPHFLKDCITFRATNLSRMPRCLVSKAYLQKLFGTWSLRKGMCSSKGV